MELQFLLRAGWDHHQWCAHVGSCRSLAGGEACQCDGHLSSSTARTSAAAVVQVVFGFCQWGGTTWWLLLPETMPRSSERTLVIPQKTAQNFTKAARSGCRIRVQLRDSDLIIGSAAEVDRRLCFCGEPDLVKFRLQWSPEFRGAAVVMEVIGRRFLQPRRLLSCGGAKLKKKNEMRWCVLKSHEGQRKP